MLFMLPPELVEVLKADDVTGQTAGLEWIALAEYDEWFTGKLLELEIKGDSKATFY